MGYVLKAVLSSAQHPEYGQITVPFPIPDEKYDRMIELLEPLEIGDALRQDCRVDELDSFYTVLNRLVGSLVNFDELDYLAKRLDSFDDGEAAQFQGMACKLGVSNIKDFINLTFCCQQATVITDFSDLDAIGRQHYTVTNRMDRTWGKQGAPCCGSRRKKGWRFGCRKRRSVNFIDFPQLPKPLFIGNDEWISLRKCGIVLLHGQPTGA